MTNPILKTFLLFLALTASAFAQTTVTGTVLDPNGNPYANGSAAAQNLPASGQPLLSVTPVATDPSGVFSMVIPSAGSWVFTICAPPTGLGPTQNPQPSQICFTSPPISIFGSAQDISNQLTTGVPVIGPSLIVTSVTANHVQGFPSRIYLKAAACAAAGPTPATAWDLPASNAATAACIVGTNVVQGTLNFADGNSAQYSLEFPSDFDSAFSVASTVFFSSSSTSGTVIFQLALACTATNGSASGDDPVFNAAAAYPTITLSAPASSPWSSTVTGLNVAGCAKGSILHVKLSRATDTAADTGVAVRGIELLFRRTF